MHNDDDFLDLSLPRKRRPSAKVLENGDLQKSSKRARKADNPPLASQPSSDERSAPPESSSRSYHGTHAEAEENTEMNESSHTHGTPDLDDDNAPSDSDVIEVSSPVAAATERPETDAEDELERLRKRWNAPVYAFFKDTPAIEYSRDGDRVHVFECNAPRCRGKGKFVRRNLSTADATSTSNLKKHAVLCWGKDIIDAASSAKSAHHAREVLKKNKPTHQGSLVLEFERIGKGKLHFSSRPPTKMESRAGHVRWMSESKRAFNTVEDDGYQLVMKTGRPSHYIPSNRTISRDVRKVFLHCRGLIAKRLQDNDGVLNFATDAWTSPNHRALVAVTVHYEKKGIVSAFLLDIVEVAESHTGTALAAAFAKILRNFSITEKILSITCDNASANDAMINELPDLVQDYPGEASRTRCFAHIINLVAKSIISQFDVPKKKAQADSLEEDQLEIEALAGDIDSEERTAYIESRQIEVDSDNDDGWVDERDSMTQTEVIALQRHVKPARCVLIKLRKIAYAVKNSSTKLLPRWRKLCKELGLTERVMPRDVKTRWNSTYDMLNFAIDYRAVIDKITDERSSNLQDYELDRKEWKLAAEIRGIMKIFKDATLFFSREAVPNLATVIPAMDHIDEVLATNIASLDFSHAVQSALSVGKQTLNRYYSKTDFSETYRIAMVLHPRHKLAYFRLANWLEDWIKTAEAMVRDNYNRKYKRIAEKSAAHLEKENMDPAPSTSTNIFDNLPALSLPNTNDLTVDEVTRYLQTEPVNETDPLRWWYERQHIYPGLSRMARDYLSVPSTSVDVERVFSGGRILLSHLRSRLQVESTRALLCVGEWIKRGVITEKDILAALKGVPELVEDHEEELDMDWDEIVHIS